MNLAYRDENTMLGLIINTAKLHAEILAVIQNGSRINSQVKPDQFQDYDIIYLVSDVSRFVDDKAWLNPFGQILIKQEPDLMDGRWPTSTETYTYLMLFQDGNRIDLTLMTVDKYQHTQCDSLSTVLLDKKTQLAPIAEPSEQSYLPEKPTAFEFGNCINEFYWVSTYVAKGLARNQIIYAKKMLDGPVRESLVQMLAWKAAETSNYKKNLGNYNKYLDQYLSHDIWLRYLETYRDANIKNIWDALFKMHDIFSEVMEQLSQSWHMASYQDIYKPVLPYLQAVMKG